MAKNKKIGSIPPPPVDALPTPPEIEEEDMGTDGPGPLEYVTDDKGNDVFSVPAGMILFDNKYNYLRTAPTRDDQRIDVEPASREEIKLAVSDKEAPVKGTAYFPILRGITAEEQEGWLAKAKVTDQFANMEDADILKYAPIYTVAEGFNRVNAEVDKQLNEDGKKGLHEVFIRCRIWATSDKYAALLGGVHLNTTGRGINHWSLFDAVTQLMKHYGWSQTKAAQKTGLMRTKGKSFISRLMKLKELTQKQREKAIAEGWSFAKCWKTAEGSSSEGSTGNDGKKRITKKQQIDLYNNCVAISKAKDVKKGTPEHTAVTTIMYVLEWFDGQEGAEYTDEGPDALFDNLGLKVPEQFEGLSLSESFTEQLEKLKEDEAAAAAEAAQNAAPKKSSGTKKAGGSTKKAGGSKPAAGKPATKKAGGGKKIAGAAAKK